MNGPAPSPEQAPRPGSVSAVLVVEDEVPATATITRWGDALAELFTDVQVIVVANGVATPVALALEALTAIIPDITVLFLADRTDPDNAHLIGLDTAIGDWVLLAEPRMERLPVLRELIPCLRDGYQAAIATGGELTGHGVLYALLARFYFWLYRILTGRSVLRVPLVIRIYSRATALFIAASAEGEMLLKTDAIAGGFAVFSARHPELAPDPPRFRGGGATISKAMRELLSATALPLRLTSAIALSSGALSLCYSVYVMVVYFFQPEVMKGWTTLSLQVSGMMFLFSVMFALMAEYVLGIYRGLTPRRRHIITREVRGPGTRHAGRLNVTDAAGAFHLGKPVETPL